VFFETLILIAVVLTIIGIYLVVKSEDKHVHTNDGSPRVKSVNDIFLSNILEPTDLINTISQDFKVFSNRNDIKNSDLKTKLLIFMPNYIQAMVYRDSYHNREPQDVLIFAYIMKALKRLNYTDAEIDEATAAFEPFFVLSFNEGKRKLEEGRKWKEKVKLNAQNGLYLNIQMKLQKSEKQLEKLSDDLKKHIEITKKLVLRKALTDDEDKFIFKIHADAQEYHEFTLTTGVEKLSFEEVFVPNDGWDNFYKELNDGFNKIVFEMKRNK